METRELSPTETELICVDCAKILTKIYPVAILSDGDRISRTFHLCPSCFAGALREFESAYKCSLISKEADERAND